MLAKDDELIPNQSRVKETTAHGWQHHDSPRADLFGRRTRLEHAKEIAYSSSRKGGLYFFTDKLYY
jgi:hypothetical protein